MSTESSLHGRATEVSDGEGNGDFELVTIEEVEAARERLADLIRPTPVELAHAVTKLTTRPVYLKHEYLQRTGSYKIRGAYNLISQLPEGVDVVAASAGNHAQGVALAAQLTGRTATIFMPESAPVPKVEATRNYGAEVILVEGGVDEALSVAIAHAKKANAIFVPPFDHRDVIAGQGTVGWELARDLPAGTEAVVMSIGGGGLISGAAVALKALRPEIKIIGVEPVGAAAMARSVEAGSCVVLDRISTMADGIAVRKVCDLTLAHVRSLVDEVVLVDEDSIARAVIVLLERAKAVVEPAGAAALAPILTGQIAGDGPICAVLSGGNIDPILLSKVIDYGLTASGRFLRVRLIMDDRPGLLAVFSSALAELKVNVVLMEHHKSGAADLAFNEVEVQLTLETRDAAQHDDVIRELMALGFPVEKMP